MEQLPVSNTGAPRSRATRNKKLYSWGHLISLSFLSIFTFIFIEWLFYATKPSFMNLMPLGAKLGILALSGLIPALAGLLVLALLGGISLLPWWGQRWRVFLWIGSLVPAFFIGITVMMLVDNFTYTVFTFGIVSTRGVLRGLYGLGILLIMVSFYLWILQAVERQSRVRRPLLAVRWQTAACAALVLLSIYPSAGLYQSDPAALPIPNTGQAVKRPNILLIGSDSMNADHMSLYGYNVDTTPFLKTFSQQTLMAENNFPNGYQTAASLISMFTGKRPTATRVLYPPDILRDADSIQHFPGILKSQGYYNAEISVDYYGDVTAMNLQDGFDFVNGRTVTNSPFYSASRRYLPDDVVYFLSTISDEALDRAFHISYLRSMQNPYTEVMAAAPNLSMDDQHRVAQILGLFNDVDQPLFIHVYMMGTHLGTLVGYDDAIRNFDGYMQQITNSLAQMGKLENTIVILYTDNGFNETSNARIPLMIRFPNAQYTGTIHNNTQNLDIGPTILDYLGVKQPAWMGGQSLLKGEPPADRAIFSAAPNYLVGNIQNELQIDTSKIKPPFNQFGRVGMVICQKWYQLDTSQLAWQQGDVDGYAGQCDPSAQPPDAQARQMLIDQMKKDGFDVSSLEPATDPNPGQ
jgi:hypothetical protein